jgi:hypothetical protein
LESLRVASWFFPSLGLRVTGTAMPVWNANLLRARRDRIDNPFGVVSGRYCCPPTATAAVIAAAVIAAVAVPVAVITTEGQIVAAAAVPATNSGVVESRIIRTVASTSS